MNSPKAEMGFLSINIEINFFSMYTVVREGITVFFYSTYSLTVPIKNSKLNFLFMMSTSALRWMRFFGVEKGQFQASCNIHAPPFSLEILTFKTGGEKSEN